MKRSSISGELQVIDQSRIKRCEIEKAQDLLTEPLGWEVGQRADF